MHIHSCGKKYFAAIKDKHEDLVKGINGCSIKPYIDNMPTVINASDIIITRCGAMTIAEVSATGVAGIYIPSPNVTNNHQYKNAKLICDGGAGIMIEENRLNERTLLDAVRILENNPSLRSQMGEKIKRYYHFDAKEKIIKAIKSVVN
jgi:UDP-N-acetylglucosamine--N-acetylmuramyl-(pentapeptide) pyrophosphoryl-undecaprenol N-acetylglucosamine transferase